MRIVVFGTGPFCVPTVRKLIETNHEIVAVVTRPIANAGNRRKTVANPVHELALEHDLLIMDPVSCNSPVSVAMLKDANADLFFVCDYGQILSRQCLASSQLGGINLHGSLLPKYRGAAPVQWAIYNGESETGVTVIHMTPKLDAGPCLATAKTEIGILETADQLELRLSKLGIDAVMQSIQILTDWDGISDIGEIQDPSLATAAPRLKKSDGRINWQRTATQLVDQIRAFTPWPTSFCEWNHGKQPLRLIVHRAKVMLVETNAPPGTIVAADKKLLAIQTTEHALSIEIVQPAGKKSMPVEDFLRGTSLQVGQIVD